jgi:hypothetical protein
MDDNLQPISVTETLAKLLGGLYRLEDRIRVLEERTASHECRLEDIEEWRDKVDDKLEG